MDMEWGELRACSKGTPEGRIRAGFLPKRWLTRTGSGSWNWWLFQTSLGWSVHKAFARKEGDSARMARRTCLTTLSLLHTNLLG